MKTLWVCNNLNSKALFFERQRHDSLNTVLTTFSGRGDFKTVFRRYFLCAAVCSMLHDDDDDDFSRQTLKLDLYKIFRLSCRFCFCVREDEATTDFRLLNKRFLTVLFLPNYSLTDSTSLGATLAFNFVVCRNSIECRTSFGNNSAAQLSLKEEGAESGASTE